jgi:hypothetical protein
MSPEKYKAIAVRYFTEKVNKFGKQINRKIKVGFSDDDIRNVEVIKKHFKDEPMVKTYSTAGGIKKRY